MHADIQALREIHACFQAHQAGEWATAALPVVKAALPHLSSSAALTDEGFPDALMALRDAIDAYDPNAPERHAFELCDRLADVLEDLPSGD